MADSTDFTHLADQLKALADPTRLRILRLLPPTKTCALVLNVSELAERLDIPQPTVSHHLRVLHTAGLVRCEKMCRDVYYWVDKAEIDRVMCVVKELARDDGQTG